MACDDQKVREYEVENRHGNQGSSTTRRGQGNGASALTEVMGKCLDDILIFALFRTFFALQKPFYTFKNVLS